MTHSLRRAGMVLGACLAPALPLADALAASHREAPVTAIDRTADITDWYAFVSPDAPDTVTMILAVDPLLEPSNGPNYFPFDDNLLYEFNVDNDQDARAGHQLPDPVQDRDPPAERAGRLRRRRQRDRRAGQLPAADSPWNAADSAGHHRARRAGFRGPEPAPDLQGHPGSRPQGDPAQEPRAPVRGAEQCRAAHHAGLRGPDEPGHLRSGPRGAGVRRHDRRCVLHRPRRSLRFAELQGHSGPQLDRHPGGALGRAGRGGAALRRRTTSRATTSTPSRSRCRSAC